jgi:hypothetical protein
LPVASPLDETVATLESELIHIACPVTSTVVPLVYIAVALSCWVEPTGKLATTLRDIAMADTFGPVSGGDTANIKAGLVTPNSDTVIFVFPAELPVANPIFVMAATVGTELDHVPVNVTSSSVPSEYVPVAVNCWVEFTVKLNVEVCLIAIDNNCTTGNVTAVLLILDKAAVISVFPGAKPLAKPLEEMVAAVLFELFQVTLEVISEVDLSEYVPVALNCCVEPACKLLGCVGVIAMEDNFGFGEQAPIAKVEAINNIARK